MGPLFLIMGVHSLVDNPDGLRIFIGIVQLLFGAVTLALVVLSRRLDGKTVTPRAE